MKLILISAGDAITAKLVQEAGFGGIWVSGFEASARLGLPDNGSITMIEMLNVCKPIVDAVDIPVYVDCDTGYGNAARTAKEFHRIGATGISIEDNLPDKINSLWGEKIPLLGKFFFGKKIEDAKKTPIQVIARTEALIRGYGQAEASERLAHYKNCGADILLPHARDKKDFMTFSNPKNLYAIVPTKFPEFTNNYFFDNGYSMVIWANQTERVKIKAIRDALKIMKESDNADMVENTLSATLDDMRNLTNEG